MKRYFQLCCCLLAALLAPGPTLNAQLDKLIELKKKIEKKEEEAKEKRLGKKTIEEWLEKSPVSTSFDDATYEIELLSEFEPAEKEYGQLAAQPRASDGGFVLYQGAYTMTARSFCLRAGTHGPSQGDGHLYAPLRGKRADFVQQILLRYGQKPEVSQQKVQMLLWAVIAGADMTTMAEQHRQTLNQLFKIGDLIKFTGRHWASDFLGDQIESNIPDQYRSIMEAESKMRVMAQKANAVYEDFERIAMLAGSAPPDDMIRQVSKGRWSYHPDGYFVRYFPNGYSRTRIDVMVPEDVQADLDQWGRIVSFNDPSIGRIELEYEAEIYAAGSMEGYNQYISKLKTIKVNGTVKVLKAPLDIPFVTRETVPASGNMEESEKLERSYEQAIILQNIGTVTAGRSPPPAASPVMFQWLLTVISMGYELYGMQECCTDDNLPVCILKKVAQSYLKKSILRFLKEKIGALPANQSALLFGSAIVFNPSSSVAVPANRSSQRIGMAPIPVDPLPPPDAAWLNTIPACPCNYDDAKGVTYNPEGQWEQCGEASQTYHFGATYEVRWFPTKQHAPGQQCTYDQNKKLIGYGLAAGSADFRSPGICKWYDDEVRTLVCLENAGEHWWHDVEDWDDMPCEAYMRLRPSSNELCLDKNPVNDWYFGQMCAFVKDFSCPDIRSVFERFRDGQDVPLVMKRFMEKGQIEEADEISGVVTFLNKCQAEYAFENEPAWHQVFVLRVRDYIEYYQKKGKNPSPCQPPFD